MRFWKTLIPDEPLFSNDEVITRRPPGLPAAVKAWCLVSVVVNGMVVAIATAIFRNAGPLLVGAIFALFPLYMLLFWNDLASTINTSKQRAFERLPFELRINLSPQWAAISVCIGAPLMVAIVSVMLWFTQMKH
jgi:hypothetical protein